LNTHNSCTATHVTGDTPPPRRNSKTAKIFGKAKKFFPKKLASLRGKRRESEFPSRTHQRATEIELPDAPSPTQLELPDAPSPTQLELPDAPSPTQLELPDAPSPMQLEHAVYKQLVASSGSIVLYVVRATPARIITLLSTIQTFSLESSASQALKDRATHTHALPFHSLASLSEVINGLS
jgi:hypothetical protein